MTHRALALVAMLAAAASTAAAQQSQLTLGDLARKVEADRAEKKTKPARTYTNSDLAAVPALPPPPPAAAVPAGTPSGNSSGNAPTGNTANPAEDQSAKEPVLSEEQWRQRAKRLRDQVEQSSARLARLLGRPPNTSPTLQQRADQEVAGIRADFPKFRQQWEALESEARAAKISLTWIEPAPVFPQ